MAEESPQHFVATHLAIEPLEQLAQILEVRGFRDVGDLVNAGHAPPQIAAQGSLETVPLQRLQTGQAAQEQQEHGLIEARRRNLRLFAVVAKPFQPLSQSEYLPTVSKDAGQHGFSRQGIRVASTLPD